MLFDMSCSKLTVVLRVAVLKLMFDAARVVTEKNEVPAATGRAHNKTAATNANETNNNLFKETILPAISRHSDILIGQT
jgi:hypothetical protein